jgi:hypothetical protein
MSHFIREDKITLKIILSVGEQYSERGFEESS